MIDQEPDKPLMGEGFIADFRCIGSDCEYTCCAGWQVQLEKKIFLDLKTRYKRLPDQSHRAEALQRNRNNHTNWDYGKIVNDEKGNCPFLTEDKLCDIHSRFGEKHLSWVCRDFPRKLEDAGDHLEASLSLGCPEAARLCLQQDDDAEMEPLPVSVFNKFSGVRHGFHHLNILQSAYWTYRHDVRQVMQLILKARQYPLSGRLFLLLYFAEQLKDSFHADSHDQFEPEKLQSAIEIIASPDIHQKIISGFENLPSDTSSLRIILHTLLGYKKNKIAALDKFFEKIVENAREKLEKSSPDDTLEYQLDSGMQLYVKRLRELPNGAIKHIEHFLENVINHYLFYRSHVNDNSLTIYVRHLLIQINIIKFLFILSPDLNGFFDNEFEDTDDEYLKNILADAILKPVYLTVRAFEHQNLQVEDAFNQALKKQGFENIEKLAMLAKI